MSWQGGKSMACATAAQGLTPLYTRTFLDKSSGVRKIMAQVKLTKECDPGLRRSTASTFKGQLEWGQDECGSS